jgi:hypothetical protein
MTKKCQTKRRNKNNRKTRNKKNKSIRKMRGGDCGCNKPFFKGGNINPPSFETLPQRYYYELNNYNNDPAASNVVLNARNLPNMQSGGKKRKSNKVRINKKMKGGDMLLGQSSLNNSFTAFGTTSGVLSGNNILLGVESRDSSVINQPAFQSYSKISPPLA